MRVMVKGPVKNEIKKELGDAGEKAGERIGHSLSKGADRRAAEIGRKVGEKVAEQVDRIHDALEKETVTKEEELGFGGKLGTGLGIIGKNLVKKKYGLLGKFAGGANLVSEGRTFGAKTEKVLKRAVKTGASRLANMSKSFHEGKKEK
jgi:hypothetical protein